jgi:general secretion pathway protein L
MTGFKGALQQPAGQLRQAWRDSPLPGAIAWWTKELQAMLPARLRRAFATGPSWFLLERQTDGWSLRHTGELSGVTVDDALPPAAQLTMLREAMSRVADDDRRMALLLPAHSVLRRRLSLPLAARGNLRQVAGYELDRQTPFRPEQVHYGVREWPGAPVAGKVTVELAAVPREVLDPLLDLLAAMGLSIDAVDVADGHVRAGLDVLPPSRAAPRVNRRGRVNAALAAGLVLVTFACMATWLHNRQAALATMQADTEAMHAGAQKVAALRQRLTDSAGAAGFLAQRKNGSVPVLAVLDELTRRLPDDTWLERITINANGDVGFQGQSPQAAKLVDALKNAKLLGEPSFQGTIATDPTSGKERFYMVAKVRKPAAPATRPRPAGATRAP